MPAWIIPREIELNELENKNVSRLDESSLCASSKFSNGCSVFNLSEFEFIFDIIKCKSMRPNIDIFGNEELYVAIFFLASSIFFPFVNWAYVWIFKSFKRSVICVCESETHWP